MSFIPNASRAFVVRFPGSRREHAKGLHNPHAMQSLLYGLIEFGQITLSNHVSFILLLE